MLFSKLIGSYSIEDLRVGYNRPGLFRQSHARLLQAIDDFEVVFPHGDHGRTMFIPAHYWSRES